MTDTVTDEFHRKSGDILRMSAHLEDWFELFISNYFIRDYKNLLFRDEVVLRMNFDRKIQLFKKNRRRNGFSTRGSWPIGAEFFSCSVEFRSNICINSY